MPLKGFKHSKKTREKMSRAKIGKKFSDEHRRRLSLVRKNQMFSKEDRKKMSLSHLGKKPSEETRKKLSINNARYWLGKHHSKKTKKKMSLARMGKKLSDETRKRMGGENNGSWQGGITPLNVKIRNSLEYKLWRTSVFERDNFTCQKCKKSGGYLIGHHINNFSEKEELQLAIDNGCTLCKKCHKEFHHLYGCKNNTKEQLEEFLNNY